MKALVLLLAFASLSMMEAKKYLDDKNTPKTLADIDQYIGYDKEGRPFVECITGGPHVPDEITRCSLSKEDVLLNKGLSCFTVWQTKREYRGCWIQDMRNLRECKKERCSTSPDSKIGVHFCCCYGHLCNSKIGFDEE
ncbi:hypothetical protein QR680_000491 [Steinernema hermaphroditum]|uniref:Activin types I and II receptor domain-containing protein n=1 Tax=Steinernema hermaphroditum TaxID=289476 RepID=A0AA39GWB4_9BILA|nr:hypothetical protein QR680_000491 [Steinernema hermaphroditum]